MVLAPGGGARRIQVGLRDYLRSPRRDAVRMRDPMCATLGTAGAFNIIYGIVVAL